jgi:hypothetical protein
MLLSAGQFVVGVFSGLPVAHSTIFLASVMSSMSFPSEKAPFPASFMPIAAAQAQWTHFDTDGKALT